MLAHAQEIQRAFQQNTILTKQELLEILDCSPMTVWRLLKQLGYYTSYNCNARFYTLADIPRFDEHGLWTYRKARFSKWGALTDTLVAMVENSQAGLTPEQLQERLHVANVRPALARLFQQERLAREKVGHRFVYFSLQETVRKQQQRQRAEMEQVPTPPLPPPEQIIALLVEIIQRPRSSPGQWAKRLAQHGVRLSTEDIRQILDHYQIEQKRGLFTS